MTAAADGLEARLRTVMERQRKKGPRRSYTETAVRAKEKLQEFRRFFGSSLKENRYESPDTDCILVT